MHEFSRTFPNLAFFDSHAILMGNRISQRLEDVIDPNDQRKIHITWGARKLITDNLVNAVELTSCLSNGKRLNSKLSIWHWPVRPRFAMARLRNRWTCNFYFHFWYNLQKKIRRNHYIFCMENMRHINNFLWFFIRNLKIQVLRKNSQSKNLNQIVRYKHNGKLNYKLWAGCIVFCLSTTTNVGYRWR